MTDGEHERRRLKEGPSLFDKIVGACCVGGAAVAPCVACRKVVYANDCDDEAEERAALLRFWASSRRPRKKARVDVAP